MNIYPEEQGLTAWQAGWLLQKTEAQVRQMLRRGDLRRAARGKVDPESVRDLLDDELTENILDRVVDGSIIAPRPLTRYGEPDTLPRNDIELMIGLMWGCILGSLDPR